MERVPMYLSQEERVEGSTVAPIDTMSPSRRYENEPDVGIAIKLDIELLNVFSLQSVRAMTGTR
jgi:hypothetical protein